MTLNKYREILIIHWNSLDSSLKACFWGTLGSNLFFEVILLTNIEQIEVLIKEKIIFNKNLKNQEFWNIE
jgi:hypothetical protein